MSDFKVGDYIKNNYHGCRYKILKVIDRDFYLVEVIGKGGLSRSEMVNHIKGCSFGNKEQALSFLEEGKRYHTSTYCAYDNSLYAKTYPITRITRKIYRDRIIKEEKDYLIVAMQ